MLLARQAVGSLLPGNHGSEGAQLTFSSGTQQQKLPETVNCVQVLLTESSTSETCVRPVAISMDSPVAAFSSKGPWSLRCLHCANRYRQHYTTKCGRH